MITVCFSEAGCFSHQIHYGLIGCAKPASSSVHVVRFYWNRPPPVAQLTWSVGTVETAQVSYLLFFLNHRQIYRQMLLTEICTYIILVDTPQCTYIVRCRGKGNERRRAWSMHKYLPTVGLGGWFDVVVFVRRVDACLGGRRGRQSAASGILGRF